MEHRDFDTHPNLTCCSSNDFQCLICCPNIQHGFCELLNLWCQEDSFHCNQVGSSLIHVTTWWYDTHSTSRREYQRLQYS